MYGKLNYEVVVIGVLKIFFVKKISEEEKDRIRYEFLDAMNLHTFFEENNNLFKQYMIINQLIREFRPIIDKNITLLYPAFYKELEYKDLKAKEAKEAYFKTMLVFSQFLDQFDFFIEFRKRHNDDMIHCIEWDTSCDNSCHSILCHIQPENILLYTEDSFSHFIWRVNFCLKEHIKKVIEKQLGVDGYQIFDLKIFLVKNRGFQLNIDDLAFCGSRNIAIENRKKKVFFFLAKKHSDFFTICKLFNEYQKIDQEYYDISDRISLEYNKASRQIIENNLLDIDFKLLNFF